MRKLVAIALAVFLLQACKKDCDVQPTGSIVGFVKLYANDPNGLNDFSGVTAKLEATNISSTTDPNGKFIFNGVKPGTYDITLTKDGYGTVKHFSYSYSGGPAPGLVPSNYVGLTYTPLAQIPTYTILSFSVGIDQDFFEIKGTTSVEQADMICVYSKKPDFSNENYEGLIYIQSENSEFRFQLPVDYFSKGTKYYFKMYPVSRGYFSFYENRDNNLRIITSIGTPTSVISFTMP